MKDLSNMRFGRWLVLEVWGTSSAGNAIWRCRCDCGNIVNVVARSLVKGSSKSCGCLRRELFSKRPSKRIYTPEDAAWRVSYNQYKRNAKFRELEFCLSFDEFCNICGKSCSYCGREPEKRPAQQGRSEIYASGIDRIDNQLGYVVGNVAPCCTWCNWAKGQHTVNEFLVHCQLVFNHNRL